MQKYFNSLSRSNKLTLKSAQFLSSQLKLLFKSI